MRAAAPANGAAAFFLESANADKNYLFGSALALSLIASAGVTWGSQNIWAASMTGEQMTKPGGLLLTAQQIAELSLQGLDGDPTAARVLAQYFVEMGPIIVEEQHSWSRIAAENGEPEGMMMYAALLHLDGGETNCRRAIVLDSTRDADQNRANYLEIRKGFYRCDQE